MYRLFQKKSNNTTIIDIKDGSNRIFNYFVSCITDDSSFLKHSKIKGISQDGNTEEILMNADFLNASINVPIFSSNFKQKMEKVLNEDLIFFPITVSLGEKEFEYYICRINFFLDIIDKDRSNFRKLTDGRLFPTKIVTKSITNENVLIAKDIEYKNFYAITDTMKELIEKNRFFIDVIAAS